MVKKEKEHYNKTDLRPDVEFERHIFHRDQFAHYLRWTHLLKYPMKEKTVLDVGCGIGNAFEVLYRNRHSPHVYMGVDIRNKTILKAEQKWDKTKRSFAEKGKMISFVHLDIVKDPLPTSKWDYIICFEVLEHVGKENVPKVLENIKATMNSDTICFISTPNYDPLIGAAENHMINGEVGELTHDELKQMLLNARFNIVKTWGTFASQKDYKPYLEELMPGLYDLFLKAQEYYDTNILSNLMAPFIHPRMARNILWKLTITKE